MNRPKQVIRGAAVVWTVVLVSAFVLFSVGAFTFMAGSKANPMFQPVSPISSPKSAKPAQPPEPAPGAKSQPPTVFGGSKSLAPLIPPPNTLPAGTAPKDVPAKPES